MANFVSQSKHYHKFLSTHSKYNSKSKPNCKSLLTTFILLTIAISSIYFKQFIVILFIIVLIILYITVIKKPYFNKFYNLYCNKLVDTEWNIEINNDFIIVNVNNNILKLAMKNISTIKRFEDGYYICHKSAFSIILPDKSLSEAENNLLESYCKIGQTNGTN